MSIQTRIQAVAATLAPSSRRVADALMADPSLAMSATISELARRCGTSETSVVRFCRSLGFSGYSELRIALTAEVGREAAQFSDDSYYGSDIGADDSLTDAISKISFTERLGIEETIAGVDVEVLTRAIDALDQAARVIAFGIGASNLVAQDLQQKLLRIGRTAFAFAGAHDALSLVSLTRPGDVVVALSHSGNTVEPVELVRLARRRGALTLAITNGRGSPLSEAADMSLYTAVRETTFRSGAMASRTAQLTLVDCLFVGIAQRSYAQTVQALRSTREGISTLTSGGEELGPLASATERIGPLARTDD